MSPRLTPTARSLAQQTLDKGHVVVGNPYYEADGTARSQVLLLPGKPDSLEVKAATRSARRSVESIFNDWNTLQQILRVKESVIRSRWNKKKTKGRREVLLAAWPGMPETHRPDLEHLFFSQDNKCTDERVFKWPHITLEDLLVPKILLLFLNARGRNPPHKFAHEDRMSTDTSAKERKVLHKHVPGHLMLLSGDNVKEYGRIVYIDDNASLRQRIVAAPDAHFTVGEGLLVLEIQNKVLPFLIKCCYEILHDTPPLTLSAPDTPVLPEPGPLDPEALDFVQTSQIAAERPYRLPSGIDLPGLVRLAEARRSAAEDHLWELRDNPDYYASDLLGHSASVQTIRGKSQSLPSTLDEVPSSSLELAIHEQFRHAFRSLIVWDIVLDKAKVLKSFEGSISSDFNCQQQLPQLAQEAMTEIAVILEDAFANQVVTLTSSLPSTAAFMRKGSYETKEDISKIVERGKSSRATAKDPFFKWTALLLGRNEGEAKRSLSWLTIIEEIQRVFDQDPAQKKKMSSFTAAVFSEMAMLSQVGSELSRLFPWADNLRQLKKQADAKFAHGVGDMKLLHKFGLQETPSFYVRPFAERLYYPIDKPRSVANVAACRHAEICLDRLWYLAGANLESETGVTLDELLLKHSSTRRFIFRTPPWTASEEAAAVSESTPLPAESFSRLTLADEKPTRLSFDAPRVKTKTRGPSKPATAAIDRNEQLAKETGNLDVSNIPTSISRRGAETMRSMFHMQDAESGARRAIKWTDFRHAMAGMNFSVQKLYGSVWQFTPNDATMPRSIQFHEPHPDSEIPYLTARRFGRRLHRAYGWTGEMFSD